ncbi:phosphomannomutase [Prunus dulcis]|uniref:Phosphomannomutase n=1 Tax=Prunus dulcis TaxID=3755 RepID=A0A4Y1RYE2_PRUDU|nr:phosphomannomutase [Prunus dulcis]
MKVVTVGIVGGSDLSKITEQLGKTEFINFTLHYIADLDIPINRISLKGSEVGCLMYHQLGRNCSQEERDEFERYDKVQNTRPKMVSVLREKFAHLNLTFSIGGQISFDVSFPSRLGQDIYCLRYLEDFQEIHFSGDKTYKGGNDHEIYESERTVAHTVIIPEDTAKQCKAVFLSPDIVGMGGEIYTGYHRGLNSRPLEHTKGPEPILNLTHLS